MFLLYDVLYIIKYRLFYTKTFNNLSLYLSLNAINFQLTINTIIIYVN